MLDITISGSECSIDCYTSRFDTQNYNIIFETWLKKSDYQDLRNSIRPGATGELYKILGRPRMYDKSWTGSNTIQLIPTAGSNFSTMRGKKVVFIKNISSSPIKGPSGWIACKLECVVSGSGSL